MKTFLIFYSIACTRILILLLSGSLIISTSCSPSRIDRTTSPPNEIIYKTGSEEVPYLKLHMNNGELYVLQNWEINEETNLVTGTGRHMNLNRETLSKGEFSISLKQIIFHRRPDLRCRDSKPAARPGL